MKGMPYPQNVETAMAVEEIIVKNGAVPATIAILEGKVHIGERRYIGPHLYYQIGFYKLTRS